MKRHLFHTSVLTALSLVASVAVSMADTFEYKDATGLYYLCDTETREAVLIASLDAETYYTYEQDAIVVPATLTIGSSSIGDQGGTQSDVLYKVTEIGENALKDSWAYTITFADNSNIRIIRRRGLYGVMCKGEFVLPASLQVIEEEGLYVKSSAKAKSFISTLVLPASLDSLGQSSIVLNKLKALQFLGDKAPKCADSPWSAASAATPADVEVLYPEGGFDVYKNAAGIGDYFTAFASQPETPTGLDEALDAQVPSADSAHKVMLNGQVLVRRDGRCYTLLGVPVEL